MVNQNDTSSKHPFVQESLRSRGLPAARLARLAPGGTTSCALDCSQLPFLSASPAGGGLFTGGARLGLLQDLRPRAIPGGLLVGGRQARGEEGRLPGHRGVREVLLASPGEARQEVGGLLCCGVRWGVGAENLPLGSGGLAVTVQEKQQKGQEEQDGRWKKDAQEGFHVVFGGAYLLGALEFGNEAGLGEEERLRRS